MKIKHNAMLVSNDLRENCKHGKDSVFHPRHIIKTLKESECYVLENTRQKLL